MSEDEDNTLWLRSSALPSPRVTRRGVLRGVAALGALPLLGAAHAADDETKLRPRPDDQLVFATGAHTGRVIRPDDVIVDVAPVSAWPMLPATQSIRDGSRLNLVRLVRLNAAALSAKSAGYAADGVLAFAAMCSHAGCDVLGWRAESQHLVCPCHGSEFDALDAAAVIKGPATKPLALLPLKIDKGALLVAGGFTRQVGFKPL